MITPSYINFVFETDGELGQQSCFEMMGPTTFEMTKLAKISHLVRRVVDGSISLVEGEKQLGAIDRDSPAFGNVPVGIGYGLSGAGFAVLMSVSWFVVLLAALLSLMVYAIILAAGRGGWQPFLMLAYADERGVLWGRFASVGLGYHDKDLDDQYTAELFYRFQLLTIRTDTPDLQFLMKPAEYPDQKMIVIAGLRVRISL